MTATLRDPSSAAADATPSTPTTEPTQADDTGVSTATETMLVDRIEAAFVPRGQHFGDVIPWAGTFDELEAELRRDGATRQGKDGRAIVMSAFGVGEGRTEATAGLTGRFRQGHLITSTMLLGLDFDSRAGDPETIVAAFRGYDAIIYSTHSHGRLEKCREGAKKILKRDVVDDEVEARARCPRFRLLLRLSRPVTDDEYRRLWLLADTLCGGGSDGSCKDPTRLYFTPRIKADDSIYEPFFWRWHGQPLNPDALPDGRKVCDLLHPDDRRSGQHSGTRADSGRRRSAVSVTEAAAAFALLDADTRGRVREAARARVTRTIERLQNPQELESRRMHIYTCGCRIGGLSGFSDDAEKFVEEMVALTLQTAQAMGVPDAGDHKRQVINGVKKGQQDHESVEKVVAQSAKRSDKQRAATKNEVLAHVDIEGLVYDEYLEAACVEVGVEPPWNPGRPGPRKLDDQDAVDVMLWIEARMNLRVDENLAGRMLWRAAKNRPVDCLRDYLRTSRWDGVPRLDTWLSRYLGARDNSYNRLVGRKWLIQAVARGLTPGCKADNVLVLEGKQGAQKSTALRVLGGNGRFFTDQLPDNLGDKDASIAMNGAWIVEMADLHSLPKTRVTTLKAFITRQVDRFRPPYGKNLIDTPRRSVLAGTTNEKGYLVDETGNRRFWPVACGDDEEGAPVIALRMRALRDDVDQLWAEAVAAYDAEEVWWLTTATEVALAKGMQEERIVEDPLALMLESRLANQEWEIAIEGGKTKKITSTIVQLTMTDALNWAYETTDPNHRKDAKAVAAILVKNGFRRVRGATKTRERPWVYLKDGYSFCDRNHPVWGYGHLTKEEYEHLARVDEAWLASCAPVANDDEVWMASYAPVADVEDAWLVELKRGVDGLADVVRGEGRVRSG
jgi:hypothetical protein